MITNFLTYINSFSFAIADFHLISIIYGFVILVSIGFVLSVLYYNADNDLFPTILSYFCIFTYITMSVVMVYGEINYNRLNSALVSEKLYFNNQGVLHTLMDDVMIDGLVVKQQPKAIGHIKCSLSWKECLDLIIKQKSKIVSSISEGHNNSVIVLNK